MTFDINPYSAPDHESTDVHRAEAGTRGIIMAGYFGAVGLTSFVHYYFNEDPMRFGTTVIATGALGLIGLVTFGSTLLWPFRRTCSMARLSAIFAGALTPAIGILAIYVLELRESPRDASYTGFILFASIMALVIGAIGGLCGAQLQYHRVQRTATIANMKV